MKQHFEPVGVVKSQWSCEFTKIFIECALCLPAKNVLYIGGLSPTNCWLFLVIIIFKIVADQRRHSCWLDDKRSYFPATSGASYRGSEISVKHDTLLKSTLKGKPKGTESCCTHVALVRHNQGVGLPIVVCLAVRRGRQEPMS